MIRLTTLGAVDLRKADGTPVQSVLRQPRRYAILAYLALARPRGFHRRDRVLAVFWPEEDQSRARHRLAQAKHYLTRSLGRDVVVNRSDEEIGIAPDRLTSDVMEFEAALDRDDPEAALALYGGELLPGFHITEAPEFERWLDDERTRLARRAGAAAWSLAERKAAAGDRAAAVRWAKRAVALEPWDEGGLRRLITLLDSLSDRAGAVAAYQDYAKRLEADLGTEPAAETQALIEAVKRRDATGDAAPPAPVLAKPSLSVARSGADPPDEGARADGSRARSADADTPVLVAGSSDAATAGAASGLSREELSAAGVRPLDRAARAVGWRRRVAGLPLAAWVVAAALVLLVVATLTRGGSPEPPVVRRIAVLPFTDLDPNSSDAHIAAALTAELIEQLHDARMIQVVSYPAIKSYGADFGGFDDVGRELGVSLIVSGRMLGSDSTIQVTISLSDAATGVQIDHRDVTVRRGENLVLVANVAEQAEAFLRPQLGHEFRMRAWQAGTKSDSAWGLLSLADYDFQRTPDLVGKDTATLRRALDEVEWLIEQARREDRRWVEPVLLQAAVAERRGIAARALKLPGGDVSDVVVWLDRADSIATEAIEMGAGASGYEMRGWIRHRRYIMIPAHGLPADSLLRAAESDLHRANELEPRRPRTLNALGAVFTLQGRYPEAKHMLEQALEADVYHADVQEILLRLFDLAFHMEEDDEAGNYCADIQRYLPDTSGAARCQILIYGWSTHAPEDARPAMLLFSNFGAKDPPGGRDAAKPWMAMLTAAVLARVGERDSARTLAEKWRRAEYREDMGFLEFEAALLARLGEVEEAREVVREIVRQRPTTKPRMRQARYFRELFENGDEWLEDEGPRTPHGPP